MSDVPELLLPAGDLETAKRALDHGADAVYVGLDRFSARAKAHNLNLTEMREAIRYAHDRGAKVFCALNILLFNEELEDALEAVATLVGEGIDAFIVQDFGLATMLLAHFPETEVHASTQMAVMNVSGAQTLEALGFDRVVLARETSLAMMRQIRHASGIDLEVFVQGALCVSYSGLCLMSSLQGDRSGNRGQCAQPCRRMYALVEDEKKQICEQYLLSPKDMNLLGALPDLLGVPVQSLKVEGRMKQPEYVALMADVYRRHLDALAQGHTSDAQELAQDWRNMAMVFNREGFSTAYLYGVPGRSMMSLRTPKNTGVPLGKIVNLTKTACTVRLTEPLCNGDGVALYDASLKPLWGGYVDRLTDAKGVVCKTFRSGEVVCFKHGIADSARLCEVALCYKTYDKALSKSLRKVRTLPHTTAADKGTLHFYVQARCGSVFALDTLLETPEGESLSYHWDSGFIVEASHGGRSSRAVVESGLSKLSGSGYVSGVVEIYGEENIFVPMSVVTKGRNAVVAHFDSLGTGAADAESVAVPYDAKARLEECLTVLDEIPPQIRFSHTPTVTTQVRTKAQAEAAIAAGSEELNILLLDTYAHDGLSDIEIVALAQRLPLVVSLPPLMKETAEEAYCQGRCKNLIRQGVDRFMVSNLGQVKLLEDLGVAYTLGDYTMNVTNDLTAAALAEIGLSRQTISVELEQGQLAALSAIGNIPLEIIVYGELPAMNTRCCPMGNMVGGREVGHSCSRPCMNHRYALEREGHRYQLVSDQFCNVYVLNDRTYSLLAHLEAISKLSLDAWRIAGAFMTPENVRAAVRTVVGLRDQFAGKVAGSARVRPLETHTTDGHFVKGVR